MTILTLAAECLRRGCHLPVSLVWNHLPSLGLRPSRERLRKGVNRAGVPNSVDQSPHLSSVIRCTMRVLYGSPSLGHESLTHDIGKLTLRAGISGQNNKSS
jgi:hypothetical protein